MVDVLYNATIYRNQAGQVQGVFAAARDVTERNKMEQELARYRLHLEELVKQRTSELEKASADLARSTRTWSSSPTWPRMTPGAPEDGGGNVSIVKRRCRDGLDAARQMYFGLADAGAVRMQGLIHDLLAYSRAGSGAEHALQRTWKRRWTTPWTT